MWGTARSRRACCVGVFFVCALLLAAAVVPAAGGPKVFSSSKGVVEIQAASDAAALELPILNASGKPRLIRARLVVPAELAEAIDTTARAKLEPSSITGVAFDVTAAGLRTGTFDGIAVVTGRRGRPDRRAIRVIVAGPAATTKRTPAAAVESLTVVSRQSSPWDDTVDVKCEEDTGDNCLPLAGAIWTEAELAGVPVDEPIGVLSSDERILSVERGEKPVTIGPGDSLFTALELDVSGRGDVGTYSGKLDLLPKDDKNATVALTVVVTDCWWWALIALALGLGLAIFVRHWKGPGGKLSHLREDAATAYEAFDCTKPGEPEPGSKYSIATEAKSRYEDVTKQIDALSGWWNLELSDEDPGYKTAVEKVATLREHADAWCALLGELKKLKSALDGIDAGEPAPKWVASARTLVDQDGTETLTFETLDELRPRVRNATALASAWNDLVERLAAVDGAIGKIQTTCLPTLEDEEREVFFEARMRACEARWELWRAKDAEDVERRGSVDDVLEAERGVARLSCCLSRTEEAVDASIYKSQAPPPPGIASVLAALSFEVEELAPAAVVWREKVRRRLFNRLVILILLAGLLYTGLNELYFDEQVYGTLGDYLATIAWGLGSTFTLDALSSAIDKFRALRVRG